MRWDKELHSSAQAGQSARSKKEKGEIHASLVMHTMTILLQAIGGKYSHILIRTLTYGRDSKESTKIRFRNENG